MRAIFWTMSKWNDEIQEMDYACEIKLTSANNYYDEFFLVRITQKDKQT